MGFGLHATGPDGYRAGLFRLLLIRLAPLVSVLFILKVLMKAAAISPSYSLGAILRFRTIPKYDLLEMLSFGQTSGA